MFPNSNISTSDAKPTPKLIIDVISSTVNTDYHYK